MEDNWMSDKPSFLTFAYLAVLSVSVKAQASYEIFRDANQKSNLHLISHSTDFPWKY